MNQLEELCARLEQAGSRRETIEARQFVIQSLSSKWNGVRVCAAKAIARWGGRANQLCLLELISAFDLKRRWTPEYSGFVKAFASSIKNADCIWILTLWHSNSISIELLWRCLENIRTDVLHNSMHAHFQDNPCFDELELSLICRRMDWPDRTNQLRRLANSTNEMLAKRAKLWISHTARVEIQKPSPAVVKMIKHSHAYKKMNRRSPILRPGKHHHG